MPYDPTVTGRSRLSAGATICWALAWIVVVAALRPGWLGGAVLLALFLIVAGVLWNWDALTDAWRDDRARRREQNTP